MKNHHISEAGVSFEILSGLWIKIWTGEHIFYIWQQTIALNDDGVNYVLMNQPGFSGSWPFLSYFIYYFYLIIHMVATSVIHECLLFTSLNFSTHYKRFLNIYNKTRIGIVTISFIIMQNTVYLVLGSKHFSDH